MRKQERSRKRIEKRDVSGSETTLEKIRRKTPWIFGKKLRKPKINFPKLNLRKFSLPTPSRSLIIVIIFILLFILQTGIIYLIIQAPPTVGTDEWGKPEFIWEENLHEAFVIESIVASILIILFSSGFILIYHASRYVYNQKIADYYLILGLLMIIITFALLQFMLNVKTPKLKLR